MPSDKSLGYSHHVLFADEKPTDFFEQGRAGLIFAAEGRFDFTRPYFVVVKYSTKDLMVRAVLGR